MNLMWKLSVFNVLLRVKCFFCALVSISVHRKIKSHHKICCFFSLLFSYFELTGFLIVILYLRNEIRWLNVLTS